KRPANSSPTAIPAPAASCHSTPTAAASATCIPACTACTHCRRAFGKCAASRRRKCKAQKSRCVTASAACSGRVAPSSLRTRSDYFLRDPPLPLLPLPVLHGERVGVRGSLDAFGLAESPPHPDRALTRAIRPLPASGAR